MYICTYLSVLLILPPKIELFWMFFFQTMQHKLAEMKTEICVTRSFVDQCLRVHNDQGLDTQQASMAKYW